MFGSLFARALTLDLGGGVIRYRTPADFALALSARTSPSPMKMAAFGNLADESLLQESEHYRDVEREVARALAGMDPGGRGASTALVDLDLSRVTEDQNWRGLLRGLRGIDGREPFKRAALQKYIEYLASGQELVRAIRENRRGPSSQPADHAEEFSARQMLVFDLDDLVDGDRINDPDELNRMPKGETLEVELTEHQSLSLMLARYRFTLVAGDPCIIIDENGNDLRLRAGKNIVGRSIQCDVAIDPIFRSVSRKHVIVEADRQGAIKLTDISTLGTFVPRGYLDNRLH